MPRNPNIQKNNIHNLIKRLGLDSVLLEDQDRICTQCKYSHCGWYEAEYELQCPLANKKLKNKYTKLQRYVYLHLQRYRNSLISYETYEKLGEEEILKDLEMNGFPNVEIVITKDNTVIAKRSDV